MARQRSADAEFVAITDEDMARFHRNAPAALARRGAAFVVESLANALELILVGGAPIVGMLWFDWSAAEPLVFLLVGAWAGILCDAARLALAEPAVQAFGKTHYDDWHVWVIVDALRRGETKAPRAHLRAKWTPWSGVFIDFTLGTIATAVIALLLWRAGVDDATFAFDRTFMATLAGMVAYQSATAAWEIWRRRRGRGSAGPLQATPGMRGIGLFLLLFLAAMLTESQSPTLAARRTMLAVNGAIVAWGVLNAVGPLWLRGETRWLRRYLQKH